MAHHPDKRSGFRRPAIIATLAIGLAALGGCKQTNIDADPDNIGYYGYDLLSHYDEDEGNYALLTFGVSGEAGPEDDNFMSYKVDCDSADEANTSFQINWSDLHDAPFFFTYHERTEACEDDWIKPEEIDSLQKQILETYQD